MSTKPIRGTRLDITHRLSRGMVGCWVFNEGTGGKIYDLSLNANHGNFAAGAAAPSWVAGRTGSALNFDGSDYVECSGVHVTANLTVISWVKLNTLNQQWARFVGKGWEEDFFFGTSSDSASKFAFSVNGVAVEDILISDATYTNDGTWYHVVGRYNGTNIAIFVNGQPSGSLAWTTNPEDADYPVRIGARSGSDGLGGYFEGTMDNVIIYNRALSASEIAWLYREPYAIFLHI